MIWMFIVILELCWMVKADEYHVVASGPCVDEGDAYCIKRVPNSFCSVTKNECFCQPAYVAIQEEYGITCKPLLTSLSCHVDKDCVHVKNSICHPGAGFCACPGGTVYVAQEHACRNLAEKQTNNSFCEKCTQINGICFYADMSDKSDIENITPKFGCSCPYKTAMPMPKQVYASNDQSLSPWAFCRAILVDVGELCNDADLICRPRNAECSSRNGDPRTCRCKSGYFPVYQQSLHYHECFKQVPCKRQRNSNGHDSDICVDLNGDGIPDDNFCSRNGTSFNLSPIHPEIHEPREPMSISYSHDWPALDIILEKGKEISAMTDLDSRLSGSAGENCGRPLAHVSCSPNRFLACFLPPNWPPYQQLHQSLTDGTAIAYLTGERQADAVISRNCVLKPYDFAHDGSLLVASGWELGPLRYFCVNLDVDKSQNRLPCGLMYFKNETVVSMKGLLEVRTDAHVWQSSIDVRFDLHCSTFIRSSASAAVANVTSNTALAKSAASTTTATRSGSSSMSKIKSRDHQTSQRQQSEGLWSQRLSDQWNLDNVRPTPAAFDLSLKAVSSSKQLVSKVLLASPIQLKATLFDPTATYTTFAVESCHASSGGVMHANIIDRGCPNTETDFGGNFLTYVFAQPGRDAPTMGFSPKSLSTASSFISIISSQFPAFVLSPNSNPNGSAHIDSSTFQSNSSSILVKIVCAFRLCAHRAWCSLPNQCGGNQEKHQRTTFMPPKIHFAVRSLILEVLNPSPYHSDESNSLGTQSCTSVFCQPRVQLLLIMVSLGAMLCLSMICGCLVSRNHYLFHLKSSTSSPNLTICPPNGNFLTLRQSNDGSKPSPTTQPSHLLPQNGVDEISVSAAFLQHEPEQNYIQFYNPPQFQSTHQHFHTLPSTCIHETYQTLPHRRHLQCGQDLFTSPQIDNRRGLVYANGDMSEVKPTLLVPVTANTHINRTQHRKNEPEWILDNHQQPGNSTFVLETSTPVEPNNHAPGIEISNIPRNSCGVVENQPLCLISGVKTLGSSPGTRPITLAPETLYRLPSKLYMMPEFSYCLASSTCANPNNSVTTVSGDNHGGGGTSHNHIEGELLD